MPNGLKMGLALLPWGLGMLVLVGAFHFPSWDAERKQAGIQAFAKAGQAILAREKAIYKTNKAFCYQPPERNECQVPQDERFVFRLSPLDPSTREGLKIEGWVKREQVARDMLKLLAGLPPLSLEIHYRANNPVDPLVRWKGTQQTRLLQRYSLGQDAVHQTPGKEKS